MALPQAMATVNVRDAEGNLLDNGVREWSYAVYRQAGSADGKSLTSEGWVLAASGAMHRWTDENPTLAAEGNWYIIRHMLEDGSENSPSEPLFVRNASLPPIRGSVFPKPSSVVRHWYHKDHLGTPRLVTDEDGTKVEEVDYKPYGEAWQQDGNVVRHLFTGQEKDGESGLYYYGARFYMPEIGRFISADSIVASPYDPQDLNRYTYTRNNPIIYVDPSGHSFFSGLVGALVVGMLVFAAIMSIPVAPIMTPYLLMAAGVAAGFAAGAYAGVVAGGGFQQALLGGAIGAVSGGVGVWAGAGGGLGGAIAGGAAGGAAAGALAALFTGQNILHAAVLGGAMGAATAAAMYGVGAAIRGAGKDSVTIRGSKDVNKKAPYRDSGLIKDEELGWYTEIDKFTLTCEGRELMSRHASWAHEAGTVPGDPESGAKLFLKEGAATYTQEEYSMNNLAIGFNTPEFPVLEPRSTVGYMVSHTEGVFIPRADLTTNLTEPKIFLENGTRRIMVVFPGGKAAVSIGSYNYYNIRMNYYQSGPITNLP